MKTRGRKKFLFTFVRRVRAMSLLVLSVAALTSCEDEELQRQLIDLRSTMDAKDKSVEQLQAQITELQNQKQRNTGASGASSEELAKAKVRIAELEQRLAEVSANPAATPQIGKIDMDAMAGKLEEDLTRKAKQLRELVQRQSPSSRIDEISMKSIEYPPQLVTPFTSAITFTVTAGNAAPMRLMFPVTADLGGSWKLPTPDEIQKAYKAAQEQPQGLASGGGGTVPNAGGQGAGGGVPQADVGGGGARMSQRQDGVFVFDWGDGAGGAQARQPQAQQPQVQPQQAYAPPPAAGPGGGQTFNNFTPPGQGGVPQQPSAPPPAAAPQAPAAPAPVMPVVGDRVIRFND